MESGCNEDSYKMSEILGQLFKAELAVAPMVALMVALGLVQVGLGQGR